MLGDCHIHAVLDGTDFHAAIARHTGDSGPDAASVRQMLERYRSNGVTYLRDGGDRWGVNLLAKRLAPEYGIAYAAPGAPLHAKGSYGSFIGVAFETLPDAKVLIVRQRRAGADFVKIMLSGIMDFNEYGRITGFTPDSAVIRGVVAFAHEQGMPVMAHVNGARAIQSAVEAGVDSIEHGYYSDAESRACLAESNAVWVPTIAPVRNLIGKGIGKDEVLRRIDSEQALAVRQVSELGGAIAPGDDAGANSVEHGAGISDEYAYLRETLGNGADDVLAKGLGTLSATFRSNL